MVQRARAFWKVIFDVLLEGQEGISDRNMETTVNGVWGGDGADGPADMRGLTKRTWCGGREGRPHQAPALDFQCFPSGVKLKLFAVAHQGSPSRPTSSPCHLHPAPPLSSSSSNTPACCICLTHPARILPWLTTSYHSGLGGDITTSVHSFRVHVGRCGKKRRSKSPSETKKTHPCGGLHRS